MNPPLAVEWDTEYSTLDDYELDTDGIPVYVKRVDTPPVIHVPRPEKNTDDGARLDTYQARRLRTIDDARRDIEAALHRANKGRDGADSVSRLERVVNIMDQAITALHEALDMLDTGEGR